MQFLKTKPSFHTIIFLIALSVYSITAFNSHGFYHADEHYQLIEFAGLKLGTNLPADLCWEFKAQIRSALQIAICAGVFKSLNYLSITDCYAQAAALRFLTVFLSLFIIL